MEPRWEATFLKGVALFAGIIVLGLNLCAKGLDTLVPGQGNPVFALRREPTWGYVLMVMGQYEAIGIRIEPASTSDSSVDRITITLLGKELQVK